MFENRLARRKFGPKRGKVTGERGSCAIRSFIICTHPHLSNCQIQVRENDVGGACGTHRRGEKSVKGFTGNFRREEITGKTET
jgi:hypothetical protein